MDSFPRNFEPRPVQHEILAEIEECIKSDYKSIILCAPTGVGKSLVGVTVARHFGSSFVITASKNLQNQYTSDFGFLKPVKGKSNFECHLIMAEKKMDDPVYARRNGMTCEKGHCITKQVTDGKATQVTCRFKPTIQDVQSGKYDSDTCEYYLQKYKGLTSAHSLWNYASFFQVMKFGKTMFGQHLNRDVAVFDEAHTIEEQIVQFVGYDIRARQVEDAKIKLDRYNLEDLDDITLVISEITKHYAERIRDIEEASDPESHPEYGMLGRLQNGYESAAQARLDINADRENFVANKPEKDMDGNIKMISIKPIDISTYVGEFLEAENNLFMSATIDKQSFCENLGLEPDDVAIVDTPRSPFPVENRKVEMLRIRSLNYRSTPEDEEAITDAINTIMDRYPDKRGLILTSSVSKCYNIRRGLSERNQRRIRICHSSNPNGKTQGDILSEHGRDPAGVLLSSSLWEGVDLKDDLSRFQIIAKVPYPNYADNRVRKKTEKFPRWYTARTITKLLQGLGRSVRSDTDWANTYVLDAAADRLLRSRAMIPRSYYDMLGMDTQALDL